MEEAQLPDGEPVGARPWRGADAPTRILAIRLHALGDTVITLPYLNAIRRIVPRARLDFLTRQEVSDIPKSVVLFDNVLELGGGRNRHLIRLSAVALLPRLLAGRYDLVLDLQRSRLTRTLRGLLRPRAWTEFDRSSPRLAGERTRATIEAAGLGALEVRPDLVLRRPDLGLDKLERAGWDRRSALVVLNPAGSFPGRSWPLESYAGFARTWLDRADVPTQFLVLGLPAVAGAARSLKAHLGDRLVDLSGRTTAGEAFALVGRAGLVVSEDSGLMHMAWVAGAPTLGLFGASRATWAQPHGSYSDCVAVCARRDGACLGGACLDGAPSCLSKLTVEEVVRRADSLVQTASKAPRVIPRSPTGP